MNPFEKLWWYESWIDDEETRLKESKAMAILIGSFYNGELAQKMYKDDNPDIISTDDEFEKSIELVQQQDIPKDEKPTRRRRKVIK